MTRAHHRQSPPAPSVDIVTESPLWKAIPSARTTLRRAITAAAPKDLRNVEVAIVLTDDQSIRALNRQWRGHDKATNVLSFPARPGERGSGVPVHVGDIVIAYETSAREAAAEGKSFLHHLSHLAVHGFLHLVGYDHESYDEAETMESLERRILARLGVPDPYAGYDAEA
ncbi:MAG: rRNA maturation RNase YbeY [Bradyrhizobiaceae bacterium]|nr:rRNA maturation RNase YbeY [Bradyrhizobiaceae bacterium]